MPGPGPRVINGSCAWLVLKRSTSRSDGGFEPTLGPSSRNLEFAPRYSEPFFRRFGFRNISNRPRNASTVRPSRL
jgi:hypothetical protein